MSSDGRAPWWYSGEDEQPAPAPVEVADPRVAPDAIPVAGPDAGPVAGPDAEPDGTASAMDWTALVAGAAKMVDWATERVMAPHAEHTDPAEHPECMVCRTVTLIGDPVGLMGGGPRPVEEPASEPSAESTPHSPDDEVDEADGTSLTPVAGAGPQPIRWIPIVESGN